MYVLTTTEIYPMIMYPAYDCEGAKASRRSNSFSNLYALFFFSFLGLILFGVNVLSVPMLYSGLIKHITADAAIGRRLERTALHAAFELLDVDDRGFLDMDQFACLVKELRPELFLAYGDAVRSVQRVEAARRRKRDRRRREQKLLSGRVSVVRFLRTLRDQATAFAAHATRPLRKALGLVDYAEVGPKKRARLSPRKMGGKGESGYSFGATI